ncbi:serine-threonine protein kinase, putative [Entamoeba dispar SAW760]|uniref:Serine-threonine protein kinase, putative n=1 Tax=Entamoeba dispar (strain ATCC PRA-260 / SAW760) TaxID=370354 RepID=B0EI68_ENTDS|nr:serine-threonine protein kinase, putative [Entamoeba dispar SAW760]EDR25790.1 serine-threonine protein kinase, putative [Entamoeba dispar SAW760]|eukprot:EDR25790.1 serine-threonine protein kinase, putative [Entamoeba dispar SAW760]
MKWVFTLILINFCFGNNSQEVKQEEFENEGKCGDGIWDWFSEECDGTSGCGKDCLCKKGYTANGNGTCVMSCMFGDGCIGGCTEPDVCDECNTTKGYTEDCQGCQEGYMWFGEGICQPYTSHSMHTCFSFLNFTRYQTAGLGVAFPFDILIGNNQKEIIAKIPNIPAQFQSLSISRCSRFVDMMKPYTYGYWFNITFEKASKIMIEVENVYSAETRNYYDTIQHEIGSDMAILIQNECPSTTDLSYRVKCIMRNGGTSNYVRVPRMYYEATANSNIFAFVHTKYASKPMGGFNIYFNEIKHVCSYTASTIKWQNIVKGNYYVDLNLDNAIQSNSVCNKNKVKGFWYRIPGADHTIIISSCNSTGDYDVSFNLIRYKPDDYGYTSYDEDISNVDCSDSSHTECVLTRTDGCASDSKLAKMTITISHEYDYLLFVGITEEYEANVKVSFDITCPQECGSNGKCSPYSGQCECYNSYTLIDEVCTKCGNGKLDNEEECDNSVEGYQDSLCTNACNCKYGTQPMTVKVNGSISTKCAVPTCGNGKIDVYEECDGGYGCDHCVCVNMTKKYSKARIDCLQSSCGDKQLDEGEECDGGDGCIECECQPGWYSQEKAHCSPQSLLVRQLKYWGTLVIVYWIFFFILLFILILLYIKLTKKIKQEIDDEKLVIFENTIIPFDKTNSQYIDLKQENPYFSFSTTDIDFGDKRPEIDEPIETTISLKNNWKENLHFTFHSGDYPKYEIMCKPFTGTVHPSESIELTISFIARCTTVLNEKVPITIRYGQLQNIIKEIKKENPDLIPQNSQSSQNSESDNKSHSSSTNGSSSQKNSHTSLSTQKNTPSGSGKSGSSHDSDSKKKKGKSKVSKFHVYLSLQVESALSTKLDYEEIHLQHPPIGGGTFGIVYRAEWRKVDVAVKVMKSDLVDMMDLLPNFMQEAEMMERIRCPYIVNFIGSVVTYDTLCLVTEFCPLGSLRKFMKTNPMSDFLKIRFCQDIARGMEYLHENDILHRDLKTDNVLVYSKNPSDPITAKVTDFGTSRSFIESSSKIALQNIGTPVYMAPEISRKDQMTLKSDVYSFAICMLEIWLGRDPYNPTKFPDSESILRFVGAGKRLDISDDCPLKSIIEQSWQHRSSDRPTFKEIVNTLETVLKKIIDKSKSDSNNKNQSTSIKTDSQIKTSSTSNQHTINTNTSTSNTISKTQTEESKESHVSDTDSNSSNIEL